MTQTAINYGRVLYELSIPALAVEEAREAFFEENPPPCGRRTEEESLPPCGQRTAGESRLLVVLSSPIIKKDEKHRVIDRVFPASIRNFMKFACDNQDAGLFPEIFEAYEDYRCKKEGIVKASLHYVTMPSQEQLSGIEDVLKKRYKARAVKVDLKEDKSLIGGFLIRCGDKETDWSLKGRLKQLERELIRKR